MLPDAARRILLENGDEVAAPHALPPDFPFGYHTLLQRDSGARPLVVAPQRCHAPPERDWGWSVQLYALRSRRSWGMGDLGDLRALGAWAARNGAGMLLVNPLHAVAPLTPQEPSPYYASSRVFRNPLYIDVEDVFGAGGDARVASLAAQARRLNGARSIDRDRVLALKMAALERLWDVFVSRGNTRAFDAHVQREGELARLFAAHCVITEQQRASWPRWPARLRAPARPAVRRIAAERRGRVGFHLWLQWILDEQLARAARATPLVGDLAVGFAPDGFDAWCWQDVIARDAHIGAPPDEFAPSGQDWGLAPFHPARLRGVAYEPLATTLRRAMRHHAGIRIDHVMGLFRLWWIAIGSRRRRAYVRYRANEMLDVLALESERAGCFVIGEDLGTVEPGVRVEMRRRRALSYRVAWFESRPPERYPRLSVAALSTHDLPTVAGMWSGADARDQRRWRREVNAVGEARSRARLQRLADATPSADVETVVERAYAALGRAPSAVRIASLDDAALSARRPNLPGASRRDNWCVPLPRTLEQLRRDPAPQRIAAAFRAAVPPA